MAELRVEKVVNNLPATLTADTIYLVRSGAGFDIYVTNTTGTVVSYSLNGASTQLAYGYFSFWAEESGALTANAFEWSWGNGDEAPANGGFPVPVDCELTHVSMTGSAGSGAIVEVYKNGVATGARNVAGGQSSFTELTTPVSFNAGDVVDFFTINIGSGVTAGARAGAHFRHALEGIKGADGAQGPPGNDGIPSACMRVSLTGQSNVNSATPVIIALTGTTINTISGGAVTGNQIDLPDGNYIVTLETSFNSVVQRSNINFNLLRNGVVYSTKTGGNYIRSTGGHNRAGDTFTDIVNITGGSGNISFQAFLDASAGTVNLDQSRSRILIQKLS